MRYKLFVGLLNTFSVVVGVGLLFSFSVQATDSSPDVSSPLGANRLVRKRSLRRSSPSVPKIEKYNEDQDNKENREKDQEKDLEENREVDREVDREEDRSESKRLKPSFVDSLSVDVSEEDPSIQILEQFRESMKAKIASIPEPRFSIVEDRGVVDHGKDKVVHEILGDDQRVYARLSPSKMTDEIFYRLIHEIGINVDVAQVPGILSPIAVQVNFEPWQEDVQMYYDFYVEKNLQKFRTFLDAHKVSIHKKHVYKIAGQLCRMLEGVHDLGIAHKDVKGKNVMVAATYEKGGNPILREDILKQANDPFSKEELFEGAPLVLSHLDVKLGDFGESLKFSQLPTGNLEMDPFLNCSGPNLMVSPSSTTTINQHPYYLLFDSNCDGRLEFKRQVANDRWEYGVTVLRFLLSNRLLRWQKLKDFWNTFKEINDLEGGRGEFQKQKLAQGQNLVHSEIEEGLSKFASLAGEDSAGPLSELLYCALDPFSMDDQRKRDCDFANLCQSLQEVF